MGFLLLLVLGGLGGGGCGGFFVCLFGFFVLFLFGWFWFFSFLLVSFLISGNSFRPWEIFALTFNHSWQFCSCLH